MSLIQKTWEKSLSETWPGKLSDVLFECWIVLPLTVTMESKRRSVRLWGLLWYALWFFPAIAVAFIPMMALILAALVADAARGPL